MKKSVAVLLILGLLLLGVTPTLAAGEQLNTTVPAQEEVVPVVLPEGEALDDGYLADEVGGNPALAVAAVVAARAAVRWAVRFTIDKLKGAAIGAAWEVGSQAERTVRTGENSFNARKIGCAALGGSVAYVGGGFKPAVAASAVGGAVATYCGP